MQIEDLLAMDGLTLGVLENLSYRSKLPISLARKIKDFARDELLQDLFEAQAWLEEKIWEQSVLIDYRIKSLQSIELKYDRYFENGRVGKTFNDLLGFRTVCDNYSVLDVALDDERFRLVDESKGKKIDNGYRGVHLYFQKDNHHYPLEIQYNMPYDRQFNNWLHKYVYKKYPAEIGAHLREHYESGMVRNEQMFKEVLTDVLSGR